MLWQTIDNLSGLDLSRRAAELRQQLEHASDQDLVLFHRDADEVFRQLFTPRIYRLYCVAFEGETNGSGLTDFCSNLMLSGRSLVEAVLLNPDDFASVTNPVPFNDDSGLSVPSIARHILVARRDEDVADDLLRRGGVPSLDGIWEELERQVGSLSFEPDWQLAEAALPRVWARRYK